MPKIKMMFAFIATDEDEDDEGVIGMQVGGTWLPLVGADEARIESLRSVAEETARITGKKVTLVKFTNREDVEVIEG